MKEICYVDNILRMEISSTFNRLSWTLESPLDCKEIQPVHPKGGQSWAFIGRTDVEAETNTLATWCEELTHWKRPWCWERLKAGGEGDDRGWDGWMASPTQWRWVWWNSRSWWWTGRPGVLQSMGSQRSDTTERLNTTDGSIGKEMSAVLGTQVLSLDPLEKEMATHSNNPAWKNPINRKAWQVTIHGAAKSWIWLSS